MLVLLLVMLMQIQKKRVNINKIKKVIKVPIRVKVTRKQVIQGLLLLSVLDVGYLLKRGLIWYMAVFYSILLLIVIIFIGRMYTEIKRLQFLMQLPTVYQLLYSRLLYNKDIRAVLVQSMPEMGLEVKKAIEAYIYEEAKVDFSREHIVILKKKYRNKYYSYLLDMFYETARNGVTSELLVSFANMNLIIQKELEYMHTVFLYYKVYMITNISMLFVLPFTENVSIGMLGKEVVSAFYATPALYAIKIVIYLVVLLDIVLLYILGKEGVGDD